MSCGLSQLEGLSTVGCCLQEVHCLQTWDLGRYHPSVKASFSETMTGITSQSQHPFLPGPDTVSEFLTWVILATRVGKKEKTYLSS